MAVYTWYAWALLKSPGVLRKGTLGFESSVYECCVYETRADAERVKEEAGLRDKIVKVKIQVVEE